MDNDAYQQVTDPSVPRNSKVVMKGNCERVWMTTPWTLPANLSHGKMKIDLWSVPSAGEEKIVTLVKTAARSF